MKIEIKKSERLAHIIAGTTAIVAGIVVMAICIIVLVIRGG